MNMLFSSDRMQLRELFFNVFEKHIAKQELDALEQQILNVILEHPEYHQLLQQKDKYIDKDYLPEFGEINPFLHMSLHLALREQINTNRPQGIIDVYAELMRHHNNNYLEVEHTMMDVLVECMWHAQRANQFPSDEEYLNLLKKLLQG